MDNYLYNSTPILVAEDSLFQRNLLVERLQKMNYSPIAASDGKEALAMFSKNPGIKLIITDMEMPNMNGKELISAVRQTEQSYTYIIVLSAVEDKNIIIEALKAGADDYLLKPAHPQELAVRLEGAKRLLRLQNQDKLVLTLAKLVDYRSEETGFHIERVQRYSRVIAEELSRNIYKEQLTPQVIDDIYRYSALHDVGKVGIPDNILHKPGKLTIEEFETMKGHTTIGARFIKELITPGSSQGLHIAYYIVLYHHERWNGTGYPQGLKGKAIPLSARIVALADVYDAITSKRCYKDAAEHSTARKIIIEEKGEHFEPEIADAFLKQENTILKIKHRFTD